MWRSRKVAVVVAVSIATAASRATADTEPPEPPEPPEALELPEAPSTVPVEISATQPGSFIRVRGEGREFACGERCVLYLTRRQYHVFIRDPAGNESATAVNVRHPTILKVAGVNEREKLAGIGLAAGGAAGILAGIFVLYSAARDDNSFNSGQCNGCADVPAWRWYVGGISLGAGLALGIGGLFLWQANAHAFISENPLYPQLPPPPPAARLRLTPAAGRQWAGLGLTGRF